jgi:hypothetical protein
VAIKNFYNSFPELLVVMIFKKSIKSIFSFPLRNAYDIQFLFLLILFPIMWNDGVFAMDLEEQDEQPAIAYTPAARRVTTNKKCDSSCA